MKKIEFISLKTVLSFIVVTIVVVLTVVLVTISYHASYKAVENSYINQMNNFANNFSKQLENFYEDQLKNANFLAKNRSIIEAVETGNYKNALPVLASFFNEKEVYEDVTISTPEKNPEIKASGSSKANGVRWGGAGYDDNIINALNGKSFVSDVNKSPTTGLPVVLVTMPIVRDNRVIGILCLQVNVGIMSRDFVKGTQIGHTGYPYITNAQGLTFAHPNDKNIFTLKISDYQWGRDILAQPSGSIIRYEWEGKDKIQLAKKNEKYHFLSLVTSYTTDISDEARSMALMMIIFGLIGIAASGIGIYIVIRKRLAPLNECRDVMKSLSQGDLTKRYNDKLYGDEIGAIAKAMNDSLDRFEKLISEALESTGSLVQAVDQISSGNQNLSQRTSEQASSLEEIASTIEEATAAIRQNADNSDEANRMSEDTMKMAEAGNSVVVDAVSAINEMSKSSKKIEEIISVINEIAFQTNLLALNAAVEAARAGEQGRGFAVVAGEVRNLAQRSGNAAKEIGKLIKESVEKVETGTDLANKSGSALREIVISMKNVARLISEIAAASREQKQGIDQINSAVADMDTMTQQNAALVEETASASEEMVSQSKELMAMMERFKINEKQDKSVTGRRKDQHMKAAVHVQKKEKQAKVMAQNVNSKIEHTDNAGSYAELQDIIATPEGSKDLKEVLKDEGFEEF